MQKRLKYYLNLSALLIALTNSIQATSDSTDEKNADLIITGAKIFTSDKQQPWAEALVVKDGKFIYVGDANGISLYESATTIDLSGKLISYACKI